jgi:predicted HTH domain antitoxin
MQIILEIPEKYLSTQSKKQTIEQFKLYSALLMFQSGELSRGAACEFAGINIYDFLYACKKHKISLINSSVESIEGDILRFQQRHLR